MPEQYLDSIGLQQKYVYLDVRAVYETKRYKINNEDVTIKNRIDKPILLTIGSKVKTLLNHRLMPNQEGVIARISSGASVDIRLTSKFLYGNVPSGYDVFDVID